MNFFKTAGSAVLLMSLVLLSGCYEEPEVQLHQPGQYLGSKDPLLEIAGTAQQDERLAQRFKMIQTDR
jgi:uncharacterized lipoprotein YajG